MLLVPEGIVHEMLKDPDPKKAARVNKAIFAMEKIDLLAVQAAYESV